MRIDWLHLLSLPLRSRLDLLFCHVCACLLLLLTPAFIGDWSTGLRSIVVVRLRVRAAF